jgi:hypothetical protein
MSDFYDEAERAGRGRFIKVPSELGAGFKGVLLGSPEKRPKMFEGAPVLTRKTGQPRYEHIITFQTDERLDDEDDGVRKYGMNEGDFSAFVDAWRDAGKPTPIDGSTVKCRVVKLRDTPTSWDTREFKIVPGQPKPAMATAGSWDDDL